MEKLPSKLERAKKRVEKIKGFYVHLEIYLAVNMFLVIWNVSGANNLWEPAIYWNIIGTPLLWGIGLAIHGLSVFGPNLILGKNWEQRQIRKYMEEEEKDSRKFK